MLVNGYATPLMVHLIESVERGVVFGENHVEGFVGSGRGGAGLGEARVVPAKLRRRDPQRLTGAPGVFDDDAHAVMAIVIGRSPMIHMPG